MKILLALALLCTSFHLSALTIIVHPSNADNLDVKTIERIFLGKLKKFPGGGEVIPVTLPEGSTGTSDFNSQVLDKTNSQLKSYWSKLVFTGKGSPPKVVSSDAEMIELISNNPSLIGFVEGEPGDTVRIIDI